MIISPLQSTSLDDLPIIAMLGKRVGEQDVALHSGDAAARHRSVVFTYACFEWLYHHQSVARASFVMGFVRRDDVPWAGEVGLGRDDVLSPHISNTLIYSTNTYHF
jgi:hypothetical protein